MTAVRSETTVALGPDAARRLWTDVRRWPTFVEGFARVVEQRGEWPSAGSTLIWESIPSGRGRVTERIVDRAPDRLVTRVFEKRLSGTQVAAFAEDADGARVNLELEYELSSGGPLGALADALFIRRAVRDMLARTLRRFAIEADEEARVGAEDRT
jgi:Polyketide cyclase / dehydrase and lipid transport